MEQVDWPQRLAGNSALRTYRERITWDAVRQLVPGMEPTFALLDPGEQQGYVSLHRLRGRITEKRTYILCRGYQTAGAAVAKHIHLNGIYTEVHRLKAVLRGIAWLIQFYDGKPVPSPRSNTGISRISASTAPAGAVQLCTLVRSEGGGFTSVKFYVGKPYHPDYPRFHAAAQDHMQAVLAAEDEARRSNRPLDHHLWLLRWRVIRAQLLLAIAEERAAQQLPHVIPDETD